MANCESDHVWNLVSALLAEQSGLGLRFNRPPEQDQGGCRLVRYQIDKNGKPIPETISGLPFERCREPVPSNCPGDPNCRQEVMSEETYREFLAKNLVSQAPKLETATIPPKELPPGPSRTSERPEDLLLCCPAMLIGLALGAIAMYLKHKK